MKNARKSIVGFIVSIAKVKHEAIRSFTHVDE
jgi:hypothetical protein